MIHIIFDIEINLKKIFWIIFWQNQYSVCCAPLCFRSVFMLVSVKSMYVVGLSPEVKSFLFIFQIATLHRRTHSSCSVASRFKLS